MADSEGRKLSDEQIRRYSRQLLLDEVGIAGQQRLLQSRVLVVGIGGLGSPAAIYLAAAGVGTIGVVDADRVETWNLHRQILHFDTDEGRRKTRSAGEHLRALNPDIRVEEHDTYLSPANAADIIRPYHVVVNGCDNFPTRYLLNDACVLAHKPLVDAGVLQFHGQASTFKPGHGCLRCLFPVPPPPEAAPSCSAVGVLGALPGQMGTLQATETLKILLGAGTTLTNRFLLYDGLNCTYHSFDWDRDPNCPVCADNPKITDVTSVNYEKLGGAPMPTDNDPLTPPHEFYARRREWEVNPEDVRGWIEQNQCSLVDVRTAEERHASRIPESLALPLAQLRQKYAQGQAVRQLSETGEPVVLYCQVGERSAAAAYLLRRLGYTEAHSLRGGMLGWSNVGGDLIKGDDSS